MILLRIHSRDEYVQDKTKIQKLVNLESDRLKNPEW